MCLTLCVVYMIEVKRAIDPIWCMEAKLTAHAIIKLRCQSNLGSSQKSYAQVIPLQVPWKMQGACAIDAHSHNNEPVNTAYSMKQGLARYNYSLMKLHSRRISGHIVKKLSRSGSHRNPLVAILGKLSRSSPPYFQQPKHPKVLSK